MARVTVEDCVLKIPNRFDLVMVAAQRARDIASGGALTIERDNDKNPVVALREIADETVSLEALRNSLIKGMQRVVEQDEPEEEIVELMAGEQPWVSETEQQITEELGGEEGGEDEAEDPFPGEDADVIDTNLG